jgi:hypothetical protein
MKRISLGMKKTILLSILFSAVLLSGWLCRYRILYYYDVRQLENSVKTGDKTVYGEKIQALWNKTGTSCFVSTYDDTTNSFRARRVAALALIKADPALAETVFGRHIDSRNPDVSGMAIKDLGIIKSKKYREQILRKLNSPNDLIRWCVVDYLGHLRDPESVKTLSAIKDSDSSEMIRNEAADQLNRLSKQAGNQQI